MSEPKRATLTSLGSQKGGEKKVKEVPKTVRISLTLRESNEKACPEHNYRDLLASAEKKSRSKLGVNSDRTNGNKFGGAFEDEENDDDVRRIAQQMEAKYGQAPVPQNKKHRRRKDDYADIGMGYDENDSFIDNTDGYDEMIPPQVTTAHGGFYINSGALEFKTDDEASSESSEEEDDDEEEEGNTPEKVASRKRVLETSESEGEDETENAKAKLDPAEKKQKVNINGLEKVIKKKLFSKDNDNDKNKVEGNDGKKKTFTVKELLREKREDLRIPNSGDENKNPESKSSLSIDNVIESVINASRSNAKEAIVVSRNSNVNNVANEHPLSTESESSREGATNSVRVSPQEVVKLPENLPPQTLEIINEIKRAAAVTSEGKVKFFSGPVNTMLLKLERECRCLGKHSRIKIYEHLAPFVKCKKDTLMRRAKNLLINDEIKRIDIPMRRMKTEIERLMPNLIQKYEADCKKILERKFPKDTTAEETAKSLRLPHKRFIWTEESKKLLRDIISVKKRCLTLEGFKKETLETNLSDFLKKEMVTLWPEGWMSYNALWNKAAINVSPLQEQPKIKNKVPTNAATINSSINNSSLTIINTSNTEVPANFNTANSHSALTITPITPKIENASTLHLTKVSIPSSSLPTQQYVDVQKSLHSKQTSNILSKDLSVETKPIIIEESPVKPFTNLQKPTMQVVSSKTSEPKESSASIPIRTEIKQECQIIDLTEPVKRKPGPKSKTRYPAFDKDRSRPMKEVHMRDNYDKMPSEEMTATAALTQLITDSLTGISKISNVETIIEEPLKYISEKKPESNTVDDVMHNVMENLKALQKMQEPKVSDMSSSVSSPVSVIAVNSSYSPNKTGNILVQNDTPKTSDGFQDMYQRHLYTDNSPKPTTNVLHTSTPSTAKSNYNSIESYPYARTSNLSSPIASYHKYLPQSSSISNSHSNKYTNSVKNLQQKPADLSQQDELFLLQNFMFGNGYPSASGTKHQNPSSH